MGIGAMVKRQASAVGYYRESDDEIRSGRGRFEVRTGWHPVAVNTRGWCTMVHVARVDGVTP